MKNVTKNKAGFTLAETLIALAIAIVLLVISIIAVNVFVKGLRQTKLDSIAETIYVTAQDRLTEISASGSLANYEADPTRGITTQTEKPIDWGDDIEFPEDGLCVITSHSSAAENLFPGNTLDEETMGKEWVVEYDANTGTVYAAFYSESVISTGTDGYYTDQNIVNSYIRPNRDSRISYGATVGYYGGHVTVDAGDVVADLTCDVEILNKETLTAEISAKIPLQYYKDNVTFHITVTGVTSGNSYTEDIVADYLHYGSITRTVSYTLDSLNESFYDKFCTGTNPLIPGEDITVSCVAESASPYVDNASDSDTDNSLYAEGSDGTTALIAYGRHLQNLDKDTSMVNTTSGTSIKYTAAQQIADINFASQEDDSWTATYGERTFDPINNSDLVSYTGASVADGKKKLNTITSLTVKTSDENAGLFGNFEGSRLDSITLIDAKVTGTENVGELAGTTSNTCTISNCLSYLSRDTYYDQIAENTIMVSGGTSTGGFVGTATGILNIKNSQCSTVINGTANAGGFVGTSNASFTVETSYTDSYIGGANVGGIAGSTTNATTIKSCYTAGFLMGDATNVAGFIPNGVSSISNSYTIFDFNAEDNVSGNAYTTAASGSASNVYYTNTTVGATNLDSTSAISSNNLKNLENMVSKLGDAFSSAENTNNTTPYNLTEDFALVTYPFPALKDMRHYGDWIENDFTPGTLVYFEVYADGTWGYYGANKNTLVNTKTVKYDGYALLYQKDDPSSQVNTTINFNGSTATLTASANVTPTDSEFIYRQLPYSIVNSAAVDGEFYLPISVTAGSETNNYYFNPHFAKTVVVGSTKPTIDGAADNTIIVRTSRQLNMLSKYYPEYKAVTKDCTFSQELDIDYDSYNWNAVSLSAMASASRTQVPIGSQSDKFQAKYQGNYHTITGFSVKKNNSTSAGLFGWVASNGSIANTFFVADSADGYTIDRGSSIYGNGKRVYIGALAGYNEGSISNCATSGFKFAYYAYTGSSVYIGGLVGYNTGSIRNSAADTPYLRLETNRSSAAVGGFVGYNAGTIYNSYSSSSLSVRRFNNIGTVAVAGFVGTNTGLLRNSYCTAALNTSGCESNAVRGFTSSGGVVKNCYYLNHGSYTYAGKLYSLVSSDNSGAVALSSLHLEELSLDNFGFASASRTLLHSATKTSNDAYPYPTSVTLSKNTYAHFGEWVYGSDYGVAGMFYWEHEEKGTNNGYHIYLVNMNGETNSTLCDSHDDSGVITEYGYGYFYRNSNAGETQISWSNVNTGNQNTAAEANFFEQFDEEYNFVCYTTADALDGSPSTNNMYLRANNRTSYASASLQYDGISTKFNFSPFFAKCITTGSEVPGVSSTNPYEIRSASQLQYLNWNNSKKNTSTIANDIYTDTTSLQAYPYLGYAYGSTPTIDDNADEFVFVQSHDVDAEMTSSVATEDKFSPIGTLYDENGGTNQTANCYIVYFGGKYDGQSYIIKNVEIESPSECVGLFGITIGANVANVILYSENNNTIATAADGTGWYSLGGLFGFACAGDSSHFSSSSTITNCAVAGYQIIDRRANHGYGGANVGGLIGMTNISLDSCSAVCNIQIRATYQTDTRQVRTGGLVGNCRGSITRCYAGGSIKSYLTSTNARIGGIVGGAFTKNTGNLASLIGPLNNGTVSYSYSYVSIPQVTSAAGGKVLESFTIANENNEGGAYNTVGTGCYYCSDEFLTPTSNVTKNGTGLSYSKMIDTETSTGLLALLNNGATRFEPVTVTENDGSPIHGKYSFPAGDKELNGQDYPMPAVITQEDTFGDTVYAHYGEWPKANGFYADESAISLDLLSTTDGNADYTSDVTLSHYVDNVVQNITNANEVTITYGDEAAATSSIVDCTGTIVDGKYKLTIRGLTPGDETVYVSYAGYTATITVNVTATVIISVEDVDPTVSSLFVDGTQSWTLHAYDRNGNELTGNALGTWSASVEDTNVINVEQLALKDGKWTLTVKGYSVGETTLSVICKDIPTLDPANTYTVDSNNLNNEITVKEPGVMGLGTNTGLGSFAELTVGAALGNDETHPAYSEEDAPESGESLFIYYSNYLDLSETEITGWKVMDGSTDVTSMFNLEKGLTTAGVNRNYGYFNIDVMCGMTESKTVKMSVDINYKGQTRTLTIDYVTTGVADTWTAKFVNGDSSTLLYVPVGGKDFYIDKNVTDKFSEPFPVPTKDGYTFLGYFTEEEGGDQVVSTTGALLVDASTITEDVTYYAQWRQNAFDLTLSASSASSHKSETYSVTPGSTSVDGYSAPARSGWKLAGWYTKNTGGTQVLDASGNTLANVAGYTDADGKWIYNGNELTLYAKWIRSRFTLATSVTANKNYIIASGNSGNVYALGSSTSAISRTQVSVSSSTISIVDTSSVNYIWTASASSNFTLKNLNAENTYLGTNNTTLTPASTGASWNYYNNKIYTSIGDWWSQTYYLRYSNSSFSLTTRNRQNTLYIFEQADDEVSYD